MSFVNYISFSRAVSSRLKHSQNNIPIFKGSSLNRKKSERKKNQMASTLAGEVCEGSPDDSESQSTVNSLRANTADQRSANEQKKKIQYRTFSKRSRDKCRNKIFALFSSSKSTFTFLTLTMVGDCSDFQAQKCLNKFLTVLRKRYGLFSYVWVAEKQQVTRRIHFHFIIDRRFPIRSINKLWVLQQYNSGIENKKISYEKIIQAYQANELHNFLNPVDVRRVNSASVLSGYLTNYISKNNDHFGCAVWHCNRSVSCLFTSSLINDKQFQETGSSVNFYIGTKGKGKGKRFENKTFLVTDKQSGKTLAIINQIFNREHFSRHLTTMNSLNALILQKMNERKLNRNEDIFQRFKFEYNDFHLDACEWLN